MSDAIITVENLSKRYLVGHQSRQRERSTTFREMIAREAHDFARKAIDFVRGRPIIQGDEVEDSGPFGTSASRSSKAMSSASSAVMALARALCSRSSAVSPSQPKGASCFAAASRACSGRDRIPPRAHRSREHLSQRRDPRHDATGNPQEV